MLWSRPRLGKINDQTLNTKYIFALNEACAKVPKNGLVFCASDFSLLPLFAAKLCPSGKICTMERSRLAQRGLHNLASRNNVEIEVNPGVFSTLKSDLNGRKISLLCAEPYFTSSILPWHDLFFWYLRSELYCFLDKDATIMPCTARLCAAGVWFKDLWKIRAPVEKVEGFNVSPMDYMIEEALNKKEYFEPEPHALWEYPNMLVTKQHDVITFDLTKILPEENIISKGNIDFINNIKSICHGVVLWMEYDLDHTRTISTGLLEPREGDSPDTQWSMHHKQAVFLFKRPAHIVADSLLNYELTFIPSSGDIKMKFDVA